MPGDQEHGLDGQHIGHGIFKLRGHRTIIDHGLGEQVTLKGILVTDFNGDLRDRLPSLMPQLARTIRRGVEGDLNLDPALSSEHVDPLVGRKLGRTSERRCASVKLKHTGGQPVDSHDRIGVNDAQYPPGFLAKQKPGQGNAVAADVHQSAAD